MTTRRLADYKALGLDQTCEIVECWCGWLGPKGLEHCNRCTLEKGPVQGRGRHHGPDWLHEGQCHHFEAGIGYCQNRAKVYPHRKVGLYCEEHVSAIEG